MSANQMCGANVAGERMLVFKETGESGMSTGLRAASTDVDFSPLSYVDLLDMKLVNKVVVAVSWASAKVVESNIPEIELDKFASGHATLSGADHPPDCASV